MLANPLQVLGMHGIWGMVLSSIIIIPIQIYWLPGSGEQDFIN